MATSTAMRMIAVAALLVGAGGCASTAPCEPQAVDGFYANCTQQTLKQRYGFNLDLPASEAEFLAAMSAAGLRTSYEGRPTDPVRSKPIPRYARHLRSAPVTHVIRVSGDARSFNEQHVAFVVDGQVVAVEDAGGAYTPFG